MLRKSLIALLIYANTMYAQDINIEDNFDDFMEVMEETTELANKNNIGADHAPGIINILKYDDMKRIGVNDLYEALELLPNVEVIVNKTGTRNIVFRGIGGIDGSGKIKIMIDGIEQNSAASGIVHFNLPIDIIQRIEVIRGPASALYGEYAFSGIINIITQEDTNHIYTRYISDNVNSCGAILNYKDADISINTILNYTYGNGYEPITKDSRDITGKVETLRGDKSLLSKIKYKDLKLNISLNRAIKGEMFGISSRGALPKNDGDENFIYDYKTIELSYRYYVSNNFYLEPTLGYFKYSYWFNATEMGTSDLPPLPQFKDIPLKTIADLRYKKKYVKLDSSYTYNLHNLIFGIELSNIAEVYNYNKIITMSGVSETAYDNLNNRDIEAIYLHDNITYNDNIMINIGARYDNYTDKRNNIVDSFISSRIAIIYDMDSINIFKAQYATSFKVPTFLEQDKGAKEAEKNRMLEFQYIYKKEDKNFKTTIFYSIIDSMIYSPSAVDGLSYLNSIEDILNYGTEIEYTQNFNNNFLLSSNISYVKAQYKDSKKDLVLYSPWLANLSLSYKPYSKFSTTVKFRYISSKDREETDIRSKFTSSTIVDLAFRYLPTFSKNLDLSFGIKNIFDKTLKYPSKVSNRGISYEDDFIINERYYFIGIDYKF